MFDESVFLLDSGDGLLTESPLNPIANSRMKESCVRRASRMYMLPRRKRSVMHAYAKKIGLLRMGLVPSMRVYTRWRVM